MAVDVKFGKIKNPQNLLKGLHKCIHQKEIATCDLSNTSVTSSIIKATKSAV